MPRIRPLTKAESAPELLPILEQVERLFGTIHAGTGIFAYCPPILQASNGLGRAITASGTVPPLVRNLAMLRVAQVVGCEFRIDSVSAACRESGASREKIAAVASFHNNSNLSAAERAAISLADAMSQTPADVSDEVFRAAAAEFTEQQLVELAATIAAENYRTRFNRAFGVESIGMYVEA